MCSLFSRVLLLLGFCAANGLMQGLHAQPATGSILWLRSDAGVAVSGDSVLLWDDQSGTGHGVTQSTAANRPRLIPYTLNGFPVVRFDGATSYMEGPPVFPVSRDYTLSLVVKILNYGATNNIVSGNSHAHWLGGTRYPHVLHGNFNTQAISSIAMNDSATIVSLVYSEGSKNASVFVNGQFADSAFVGTNTDSTFFLGAFQRGNFLNGDLAEILLFPRRLSDAERVNVESYYFVKYNIPIPPPQPKPDTTFAERPSSEQLVPRGSNDSAAVRITGAVHRLNYDSIYCTFYKNNALQRRTALRLVYAAGAAPFAFAQSIHAELSEYKFVVGIKKPGKDTVLATWDSVVCGDAFLVCGQSNSIYGAAGMAPGQYCRTFGINFSSSPRDTAWGLSDGTSAGGGRSVGAWAMRIQKLIQDSLGIPTCVISGGVGGTTIEQHQRDSANHENRSTIYGSMLYRVDKSGLRNAAKAMFWYQGESNQMTSTINDYPKLFRTLYNNWNQDYPNLEKFYVVQIHPGCAGGPHKLLREFQRENRDSFPRTSVVSVMGVPGHDGCHYNLQGYTTIGDNIFRLVNRDFYPAADSAVSNIEPPNIERAFYTSVGHDTIALVFQESNAGFVWPEDTTVGGVAHNMAEALYLDTMALRVESGWIKGDTVMLKLIAPSTAKYIAYIPDQNYEGTTQVYEGPWLKNRRGIGALSFANVPITERPKQVGVQAHQALVGVASLGVRNGTGWTAIDYTLPTRMHALIDLSDLLGNRIRTLSNDIVDAGTHTISLHDLPSGVVFCRLITELGIVVRPITLVH